MIDARLEQSLGTADREATRALRRERASRHMILAIAIFVLSAAARMIGC